MAERLDTTIIQIGKIGSSVQKMALLICWPTLGMYVTL
jgi:hypothetical protein